MTLTSSAIAEAAHILIQARRDVRQLDALPEACRPATMAEGYAIQDLVRVAWGSPVAGWKTGATAITVQEKFGVTEPFSGPFFADTTYVSPARVPVAGFLHQVIECEFAFRFGRHLSPGGAPVTRADIKSAVDALVPAIEIVGPRFKDLLFGRAPTAAADCAVNAGFVLGQPVLDWHGFDLIQHPVRLTVDGALAADGVGAAVLGDPIAALHWTVNHLHARGISIEAGQVLSTGTATGIVVLPAGATAVADFGALGRVELTLTA